MFGLFQSEHLKIGCGFRRNWPWENRTRFRQCMGTPDSPNGNTDIGASDDIGEGRPLQAQYPSEVESAGSACIMTRMSITNGIEKSRVHICLGDLCSVPPVVHELSKTLLVLHRVANFRQEFGLCGARHSKRRRIPGLHNYGDHYRSL